MVDFLTTLQRSALMASIRGKRNKTTELVFASLLRQHKIKNWRRHYPIEGCPDFVFPKQRLAIFIDGCFWHGCRWHSHIPQSNRQFWTCKFDANKQRDRRVTVALRAKGWKVVRIWEHELKNGPRTMSRVQKLLADLR